MITDIDPLALWLGGAAFIIRSRWLRHLETGGITRFLYSGESAESVEEGLILGERDG